MGLAVELFAGEGKVSSVTICGQDLEVLDCGEHLRTKLFPEVQRNKCLFLAVAAACGLASRAA